MLSLPGGVFNPYSGVKTSVLVFTRGERTEDVLFLHADADGFKMDANHDAPVEDDDLPALLEAYQTRAARRAEWAQRDEAEQWTAKWWFADAETIRTADFNLSAGRYRPQSRASVEHRDPLEILDDLLAVEREIVEELGELRELTRGLSR